MRDELIEMLAHELFEMRYFEAWEKGDANRQGWCRADAATMLPGVVAFVSAWLVEAERDGICDQVEDKWQREMRA